MFVGDESGVEAANGGFNDGCSLLKRELFLGRRRDERGSRVVELFNLFDDASHLFFNLHGVDPKKRSDLWEKKTEEKDS